MRGRDPVNRFERFIGIDWSGARGQRHRAIAVAKCEVGRRAPMLVSPPSNAWARADVLSWLVGLAARGERALIGMDFSFAPPFADQGAYLLGKETPATARPFWAWVDALASDIDLGAARVLENQLRPYCYFGMASGAKASFQRWRVCEAKFNGQGGGRASSIFDCVGASQVGKASFAGMRLLHRLGGEIPVWPFDPVPDEGPVLVEIYTRVFLQRAGGRGLKLRDRGALNAALAGLGSEAAEGEGAIGDHAADAMVTAAGLRAAVGEPQLWRPEGMTFEIAATEGWTFGV